MAVQYGLDTSFGFIQTVCAIIGAVSVTGAAKRALLLAGVSLAVPFGCEVSSSTARGTSLQSASHGRRPSPLVTSTCEAWL